MIRKISYLAMVEVYLNKNLPNLDPEFTGNSFYLMVGDKADEKIDFVCLDYVCRLVDRYASNVKGGDNFELVNEAYRLIFRFIQLTLEIDTKEYSNLYKVFTSFIHNPNHGRRKYFDVNDNTLILINGK